MTNPLVCPGCDSSDDTVRLDLQNHRDTIEETYLCEAPECGMQYTVRYEMTEKEAIR